MVIGEVYIGSIPDTITTITQFTMVYCCVYLVLLAMYMIVFVKVKVVIVGVMLQDVKVGIKILSTRAFTMMKKVLIVMSEVDFGRRPAPLPPIIQVCLLCH